MSARKPCGRKTIAITRRDTPHEATPNISRVALVDVATGDVKRLTTRTSDETQPVFSPDGRMLAAGITGWVGLQALVNLGAVTGVLPITGVPLPFISYGGSSLVVSLVAAGVLVSIGRAGLKAPRRSRPEIGRSAGR